MKLVGVELLVHDAFHFHKLASDEQSEERVAGAVQRDGVNERLTHRDDAVNGHEAPGAE